MTLSDNLVAQLQEAIQNAKAPDHYWHYNDKLSVEHINTILALPDGIKAVEDEIIMHSEGTFDDTERDHIIDILKKFRSQIQQELENDSFGSTNNDWDELIDEYNLLDYSPGVNTNIMDLVSNTRPKVVLELDLYFEYGGNWKKDARYKDVRHILRFFNLNPRHISNRFPYHGRRKGRSLVTAKDLVEQWDNIGRYGGQYMLPIRLNLPSFIENIDQYQTGITILKGSDIWLHNSGEGSGSISIPLQKNLKIMRKDLDYSFGDDRETAGYGMDETYGLSNSAWNNYIKPVNVPDPQPYTLTPVEQVVKGISYTSAISQIHNRWTIRAYNNTSIAWKNTPYKPGELMEFDLNYMDNDFPESGKKYLRTKANREAVHYAFKIREIIGSVPFVYGHIIVNYSTGEIVWRQTKYNERSCTLFNLIEEKLKQIHPKQTDPKPIRQPLNSAA